MSENFYLYSEELEQHI